MCSIGIGDTRISAIICTHQRPDTLREAVASLLNQSVSTAQYEVIVVVNSRESPNADIAELCPGILSPGLSTVSESRLGLSYARNTGVRQASADLVAFLDDDAVADPDWLARLLEVFDTVPDAWAVGGRVDPIWDGARPAWLHDSMLRSLSIVDWGSEDRALQWPERLIGTNCAFRKAAFSEIGLFATNLGRRGALLLGHEDTEIQERIHASGKLVYYTPQALVHHHVAAERLKKKYFYARAYGTGRSEAILTSNQEGKAALFRRAMAVGMRLPRQWLPFARIVGNEEWRFAFLQGQAYQLGILHQALRCALKRDRLGTE